MKNVSQARDRLTDRTPREFFARDVLSVSKGLLGRTLVHELDEGVVAGRIVEVEAYHALGDQASHAARGQTARNSVMFGPPGYAYVYFTYGMHHCLNLVAEPSGVAAAVLIRAVEPLEGLDLMRSRRAGATDRLLASGPGRLAQAFGITLAHNGADLVEGRLWIDAQRQKVQEEISVSPRIGISAGVELAWRFYIDGPWVSRRRSG